MSVVFGDIGKRVEDLRGLVKGIQTSMS
jgi:hypothetical protein